MKANPTARPIEVAASMKYFRMILPSPLRASPSLARIVSVFDQISRLGPPSVHPGHSRYPFVFRKSLPRSNLAPTSRLFRTEQRLPADNRKLQNCPFPPVAGIAAETRLP